MPPLRRHARPGTCGAAAGASAGLGRCHLSPLHPAAARGFAAGADAYATGRPGFPPAIGGWLRTALDLGPGKIVVDLGAGTGKFTDDLIATGATVIAIEPVAAMRARLAARLPAVRAIAGTAEAIPLGDGTIDAIVCAQAFHWFANRTALGEIARILRPGGALGLVWNVRDERVAWVAALTALIAPYEGMVPRYRSFAWHALFPAPGFTPLERQTFRHVHRGPAAAVIEDRIGSISFIAALPAATRAEIAAKVRALIDATPALAARDDVAFPYETAAYSCRRC